jgi:hypothetical protein
MQFEQQRIHLGQDAKNLLDAGDAVPRPCHREYLSKPLTIEGAAVAGCPEGLKQVSDIERKLGSNLALGHWARLVVRDHVPSCPPSIVMTPIFN